MSFDESNRPRRSHLHDFVNGRTEGIGNYSCYSRPSRSSYSKAGSEETIISRPDKTSSPSRTCNSSLAGGDSTRRSGSSSFLSKLADEATNEGCRSQGTFHSHSPASPGSSSVRSNIENRLRWMETAFKNTEPAAQEGYNVKATLGSARRRIMMVLREQLTTQVRSELEALDRELVEISDRM